MRADKDLAFMLRYENIAWFDQGEVRILDRRVYPNKVQFVTCKTHLEVKRAIADMVTQSAGPYTAASMGMALAGYECRNMSKIDQIQFLKSASHEISHARPTTVNRMQFVTNGCLDVAIDAIEKGENVSESIKQYAIEINNIRYKKIEKIAEYLISQIPQNGKVLTQCFGETIVGMMLKKAREKNSDLSVYCAETRPYLQGARLTASVAQDMGFRTTLVTDNMPAFLMQNEKIDVFTSAADVITGDGYVVNKVGTFQIAIAAKYLGVPYFATGVPDRGHDKIESVEIEWRNPDLVLEAMGQRTAMQGVNGYYPAFDITPPELVTGVVTDNGIYKPLELMQYYCDTNNGKNEIII